jgi:hypothetical protein
MLSVNEFKVSRNLEAFSDNNWIEPACLRNPAAWRKATSQEDQDRGIDYWHKIGGEWYSFEVKTENYPVNYFVEMFQLVESRRSFELGYGYKCHADFLVLGNLLGLFAVVVPRAAFLQHTVDGALQEATGRQLSLVVNAKKDVVERAAIGFALPYAKSLASFSGPWALVDFNSTNSHAAAVHFVSDSLWYIKDADLRAKETMEKLAAGRATFDKLVKLPNRTLGTRRLETAFEQLAGAGAPRGQAAIDHRREETFAWAQRGLVTSQAQFAARFTEQYQTTFDPVARDVSLSVRGTQAARSAKAQTATA